MHDTIIHAYTRAEALSDGVLIDITEQAKACGFRLPTAITEEAFLETVTWTEHDEANFPGFGQSPEGRLHDVLTMAFLSARSTLRDVAKFTVLRLDRHNAIQVPTPVAMKLHIGPGDDPLPVLTIMLMDES